MQQKSSESECNGTLIANVLKRYSKQVKHSERIHSYLVKCKSQVFLRGHNPLLIIFRSKHFMRSLKVIECAVKVHIHFTNLKQLRGNNLNSQA